MGMRKEQPAKIILSNEQAKWLKSNFPFVRNEIIATYLGVSLRSVSRLAKLYGLTKSSQFMADARAFAAKKAKESHLKNGTYPPKGFAIPNAEKYRFKPGH